MFQSARFESPSAVAAQIGVASGHMVIDADRFILSSGSDDDADSSAVPERSDSSAADTATLRSNRQKRWERLNRSLEDDLNRISVVAEDDTGEIPHLLRAKLSIRGCVLDNFSTSFS